MKAFSDVLKKSFAILLSVSMVAQTMTQYTYAQDSEQTTVEETETVDDDTVDVTQVEDVPVVEEETNDAEENDATTNEEEETVDVENEPEQLTTDALSDFDSEMSVSKDFVATFKYKLQFDADLNDVSNGDTLKINIPKEIDYSPVEGEVKINGTIVGTFKIDNDKVYQQNGTDYCKQMTITFNDAFEKDESLYGQDAVIDFGGNVLESYKKSTKQAVSIYIAPKVIDDPDYPSFATDEFEIPAVASQDFTVTNGTQTINGYDTTINLYITAGPEVKAGDTISFTLPTTLTENGKTYNNVISYESIANRNGSLIVESTGKIIAKFTVVNNLVTITYNKNIDPSQEARMTLIANYPNAEKENGLPSKSDLKEGETTFPMTFDAGKSKGITIDVPPAPTFIDGKAFTDITYDAKTKQVGEVYFVDGNTTADNQVLTLNGTDIKNVEAMGFTCTGTFTYQDESGTTQTIALNGTKDLLYTKDGSTVTNNLTINQKDSYLTFDVNTYTLPTEGKYKGYSGTFEWTFTTPWVSGDTTNDAVQAQETTTNSYLLNKAESDKDTLYFIKEKESTFDVVIRAGDTDVTQATDCNIQDIINRLYVNTLVNGTANNVTGYNGVTYSRQLSQLPAGSYSVTRTDKNEYRIIINDEYNFTKDGTRIDYFLSYKDNGTSSTWNGITVSLNGENMETICKVENNGIYSNTDYDYGVFDYLDVDNPADTGQLVLTLQQNTGFQATKIWRDQNAYDKREAATFTLYRYTIKGDTDLTTAYETGAVVKVGSTPIQWKIPANYGASDETSTYYFEYYTDEDGTVHNNSTVDYTDLPLYDKEGYQYEYFIEETLPNGTKYEQRFGEVDEDTGEITRDVRPYEEARTDEDKSLYNGGTLNNVLNEKVTVPVTKTWLAKAFQSQLNNVKVTFQLQETSEDVGEDGTNDVTWNDVTGQTLTMDGFGREIMTRTLSGVESKYDNLGRIIHYRWKEVKVEQLVNGEWVDTFNPDDETFTLQQSLVLGGEVKTINYKSDTEYKYDSVTQQYKTSVANNIDDSTNAYFLKRWYDQAYYDESSPYYNPEYVRPDISIVVKQTNSTTNEVETSDSLTLHYNTDESDPGIYPEWVVVNGNIYYPGDTFTMTMFGKDVTVQIDDNGRIHIGKDNLGELIEDSSSLTYPISFKGLPKYSSDGDVYSYYILETVEGSQTYQTIEDYQKDYCNDLYESLSNGIGDGSVPITVKKYWVDDNDSTYRGEIQVQYFKQTDDGYEPYTVSGQPVYSYLNDNDDWMDTIYVSEEDYSKIIAVEVGIKRKDGTYYEVPYDNKNDQFEEIYDLQHESGESAATDKGTKITEAADHEGSESVNQRDYNVYYAAWRNDDGTGKKIYPITNQRIGTVEVVAQKTWIDGYQASTSSSATRTALQDVLEELDYQLGYGFTVKNVKITVDGEDYTSDITAFQEFTYGNTSETVTITQGKVTINGTTETIDLPKYNAKGQFIGYEDNIEEQIRTADGETVSFATVITELNKILKDETSENAIANAIAAKIKEHKDSDDKDAYYSIADYALSIGEAEYTASEDDAKYPDTYEYATSNRLSANKNVHFYIEWIDSYQEAEKNRFDIYLDLYKTVTADDGTVTYEKVFEDRQWNFGSETPTRITHYNTTTGTEETLDLYDANFANLSKYDENGNQIYYYAIQKTKVDLNTFDYVDPEYYSDKTLDTYLGKEDKKVTTDDQVVDVDSTETEEFAVKENLYILNQIEKSRNVTGQKEWKSLPSGYSIEDVPDTTFYLLQSTMKYNADGTTRQVTYTTESGDQVEMRLENGVATYYDLSGKKVSKVKEVPVTDSTPLVRVASYTITSGNWSKGATSFTFTKMGNNNDTTSNIAIPKYDNDGYLYNYSIGEHIDYNYNQDEMEQLDKENKSVFVLNKNGNFSLNNTYKEPEKKTVKIGKYVKVPANTATPLAKVSFDIYRYYQKNNKEYSTPTWYDTVTVDLTNKIDTKDGYDYYYVETTEELPVYAPNGSEYGYSVEENELDGYDTTSIAETNPSDNRLAYSDVSEGTYTQNIITINNKGEATKFNKRVTYANEYNPDKTYVAYQKKWIDDSNANNTRPNLSFTLTRTSPKQKYMSGAEYDEDKQMYVYYYSYAENAYTESWDFDINLTEEQDGKTVGDLTTYSKTYNDVQFKNTDGTKVTTVKEVTVTATSLDKDASGNLKSLNTSCNIKYTVGVKDEKNQLEIYGTNGSTFVYKITEKEESVIAAGYQPHDYQNVTVSTDSSKAIITNSYETKISLKKIWQDKLGSTNVPVNNSGNTVMVYATLYASTGTGDSSEKTWSDWEEVKEGTALYSSISKYFSNKGSTFNPVVYWEYLNTTKLSAQTKTISGLPTVLNYADTEGDTGSTHYIRYTLVETNITYDGGDNVYELTPTVSYINNESAISVNYEEPSTESHVFYPASYTLSPWNYTEGYESKSNDVTNVYDKIDVELTKTFEEDPTNKYHTRKEYDSTNRTTTIYFYLQKSTDGKTWTSITDQDLTVYLKDSSGNETLDTTNGKNGVLTLTYSNSDTEKKLVVKDLPEFYQTTTGQGAIQYRFVELNGKDGNPVNKKNKDGSLRTDGVYADTYTTLNTDTTNVITDSNTVKYQTAITNTLETVNVYAEKDFEEYDSSVNLQTVTFRLQYQTATGWSDVRYYYEENGQEKNRVEDVTLDGKADTSTSEFKEYEAWKAEWTNLPKVYPGSKITNGKTTYRIVEYSKNSYPTTYISGDGIKTPYVFTYTGTGTESDPLKVTDTLTELKVSKTVNNPNYTVPSDSHPFTYSVDGIGSKESYSYVKYDATDTQIGTGTLTSANNTFTLLNNQYVKIYGLKRNTNYTVTETSTGWIVYSKSGSTNDPTKTVSTNNYSKTTSQKTSSSWLKAEIDYLNDREGDLTIDKNGEIVTGMENNTIKADNGHLQGAQFSVQVNKTITLLDGTTISEGKYIVKTTDGWEVKDSDESGSWITGTNGTVTISDLPLGDYKVTEISAPKGYKKITNPITVSVKVNDDHQADTTGKISYEADFENTRQTVKVTITKKDSKDEEKLLDGVEFEIYNKYAIKTQTEYGTEAIAADTLIQTGTTTNGTVTFTNLPYGEYYVKEKTGKAGYIKRTDKIDVITSEDLVDSKLDTDKVVYLVDKTIKNEPTELSILKVDADNNPVEGATLSIYKVEDGKLGDRVVGPWTSEKTAKDITATLATGTNYRLVEEKAPTGYYIADPIDFTLNANGKLVVDGEEQDKNEIKMNDPKISATIKKVDSTGTALSEEIEGLELQILDGKNVIQTISTSESTIGSEITYDKEYVLHESSTPTGYVTAKDITFKVDGTNHIVSIKNGEEWRTTTNNTIVMMDPQVKVTKVDENGNLLDGAKFAVYAVDEEGNYDKENPVDTWTTREDTNPYYISNLVYGNKYIVVETEAPKGYTIAPGKTFTAGSENLKEITMTDKVVTIQKVEADGKTGVKDAVLTIYDGEEPVTTVETDGTAQRIDKLVEGKTYTVKETTTPAGYVQAAPFEFTADFGEKTTKELTMVDPQVSVTKVDENGDLLDGAKFAVYAVDEEGNYDKENPVDTWTTREDTNPYYISNLVYGNKYIVVETEAPKGYTIAPSQTFTAGSENLKEITMTDKVVTIQKVEADGKTGVKDAVLTIYDGEEPVTTVETDGTAQRIDKLVEGKTYTVKETTTPAGYVQAEPFEFTADFEEETTKELTMVDPQVSVTKVDENGDLLDGAKFAVYALDEEGNYDKENPVDTWTTGEDTNPYYISNLVYGNKYIVVETEAPKGYTIAPSQTFTAGSENLKEITMTDKVVTIQKVEADGKTGVKDAVLTIYDGEEPVTTVETDGTAQRIDKLVEGKTYTVKETTTPAGYVQAAPFEFTADFEEGTTKELTMVDPQVKVEKVDQENNPLPGAELAVYESQYINEDGTIADGAQPVDSWTSDGTEHYVNKLEYGKDYTLVEVSTPKTDDDTYYVKADNQKFTINEDFFKDGNTVTLTMVNTLKTKVEILKVWDDDNDLEGLRPQNVTVKLLAYDENNKEIKALEKTAKVESGSKVYTYDDKEAWHYTFEDLPVRYNNDNEWTTVTYDAEEIKVGDYDINDKDNPYNNVLSEWIDLDDGTRIKLFENELKPEHKENHEGRVSITKKLTTLVDGEEVPIQADDATFYVALFKDNPYEVERPTLASKVYSITYANQSSSTVEIAKLDTETTYYFAEVRVDSVTGEMEILKPGETYTDENTGKNYTVKGIENNGAVTTGDKDSTVSVEFRNCFEETPYPIELSLHITKNVVDYDEKAVGSDETFYAGIFTDKNCTKLADKDFYNLSNNIITLKMNGASTKSETILIKIDPEKDKDLYELFTSGELTFYINETDEKGNLVSENSKFSYTVTIENKKVTLTKSAYEKTTTIKNKKPQKKSTKTGIDTNTTAYMSGFITSALGALILLLKRRRFQE